MSSALVVVALMALGNIVPQSRQIMQEVTGLPVLGLGIMPVMLLMGTLFCESGAVLASQHQTFSLDGASLDAPDYVQLFSVAAVLGVFAAAVRDAEDDQGKKEKKTVELVRADRIATRMACAAGFLGLYRMCWSWSDVIQATAGAAPWIPASPKFLEANSEVVVEVPEGIQLLTISVLLYVFKMVVDSDEEDQKQSSSQVQLVSASRIASRFAVAAAVLGLGQFMSSCSSMIPASPAEGFGKSGSTMEVSEGMQLMIVSALLLVFMKAIGDDGQEDGEEAKHVQLVRADAIAFRLSMAAGIWGLMKILSEADVVTHAVSVWTSLSHMVPTSPADGFGKSEAVVEVPEGIQLLVVSLLLFVFKMAISEADDTQGKPKVQLVRADAIAFRLALASGFFGLLHTMRQSGVVSSMWVSFGKRLSASPAEGFGKSETTLDVSEGMQWLIAAALILTFKMAISDADDTQSESKQEQAKKKVELVSAQAIATRFSFAAMAIGLFKLTFGINTPMTMTPWNSLGQAKQAVTTAFMTLSQIFHTASGFAESDIALEVPEGLQLLLVSALIFVFKLAIDSDQEPEQSSEVREKSKVELVSASRIALRLAVAGGVVGAGKLAAPALTHSMNAVMGSGELLAKGGMLGASTALVLWNAHKQAQNVKA
jgi:hypothetical protein